jgi:signal transduction histidine kinase
MTLGLILFASVYPRNNQKKFNWFFLVIFFYMVAYLTIMWGTDWVILDVTHISESYNSIALMGNLYIYYWIPIIITAFYVITYYIKQTKILQGIEKRQVQFYVAGGIIMLLPVFLFDFILPILFENTSFYKFSTLGNAVWTLIVGYSIVSTRFLDVKILFGSLIVIFAKSILLIFYTLTTVYFIIPIWDINFSTEGILKLLLVSVLSTFFLTKSFGYIENKLFSKFVYTKYHPVNTLTHFASLNAKSVSIRQVLNNLSSILKKSFKPDFISILLFDSKDNLLEQHLTGTKQININQLIPVFNIWRNLNSNRILIYSELERTRLSGKKMIDDKIKEIINFMSDNKIEIIFPIIEESNFQTVLLIGKKQDKVSYTVNEIEFLDGIIQNTHMALIRCFLYSKLQSLNSSLQQKVSEQTKELQQKVKQLEEARRKEADMIDIMGHELRTPMSIVKLNTDLLHNFTENVIRKKEDFIKYVTRIRNAVETEIVLINTLLSSAKLEGDKIDLNPTKVDIVEQIKMAMHAQETRAKRKGIQLITQFTPTAQNVYADHARTIEIVSNLIDNAVKYTQEGYVKVTTEDEGDFIRVSVIDTGMGISQEDVDRLGTKFFRTSNYTQSEYSDEIDIVRPGGSGLGLYVVFNLVEKMGGEIHVESELGQGSNFTFALPKYRGQKSQSDEDHTKDMFERLGLKKEENSTDKIQQ